MSITITSFDVLPPTPAVAPKGPARPKPRRRSDRGPSSRYDAAQTTPENANHWANADGRSGLSAASADVRYRLRTRSRYEEDNNGHADGLNSGRANDTIGTGPRLQLTLPETFTDPDFGTTMTTVPPDAARVVERRWAEWCAAVELCDDLHVMDLTETRDGEVFAIQITNPLLPDTGPQLDVKLVEADQVTAVTFRPDDPQYVDGIRFDAAGNPVSYDVLRRHPGDTFNAGAWEYDTVPAARVTHLFRRKRPGQARGIPALTASLPLWAILRRYTLATLGSAELGAMISGVIEADAGGATPDGAGDDPPEVEGMDQVPFARNALLTLPPGQKAKGFDSKQPVAEYGQFKAEVLTEGGRPINAPRNVSTGSSAEYNYSSGRLDHLPYQQSVRIRRHRVETKFLNKVFAAWLREASLIPGYLPADLPPVAEWAWEWYWDGFPSIDPLKDASANQTLLESGQTTLKKVCAERGEHWEDVMRQRAREKQLADELGLTPPAPKPKPAPAADPEPAEEADG